jgi:hypothetical protein
MPTVATLRRCQGRRPRKRLATPYPAALGLNPDVRNGYERITVRFTVKGDAPAEKLRQIVEQSRARSAVYDIITNRVPVTIEVDTL